MAGEEEAGGQELDAELAFIQKKVAEGVNRKLKEADARHQAEFEALRKQHQDEQEHLHHAHREELDKLNRDIQLKETTHQTALQNQHQGHRDEQEKLQRAHRDDVDRLTRELKDKETAHHGEMASLQRAHQEDSEKLQRVHREEIERLQRDLQVKTREEIDAKTEKLTDEFAQEFANQEQTLKGQLAVEKKAFEEELRRRSDQDLARDKRDLEETFQARVRRREEELRSKLEEDLKVREGELRRVLEVEYSQRLTQDRSKLDQEFQGRTKQLETSLNEEIGKKLEMEKARLENENARRLELEENRLSREHKDQMRAEEQELRERTTATLESERRKIEEGFRTRLLRRGRYSHLSHNLHQPLFPFPAMVGMEKAKRALILNAINPAVGGVVLWGAEGNGKFSMLLSFAELLSPQERSLVGREDEHKAWNDEERYLVGRIHYGREMAGYLIDTYLQTAALSLPRARRHHDSVSAELPPLLLSTLKEEDEQAYHLISEYTLHVEVQSPTSIEERLEIMHRNSEFRKDANDFRQHYAGAGSEILGNVTGAKDRLASVAISTKILALIARMTILDKQSARLDVLMEHLSRTNAAFDGRQDVDSTDVMEAADLALMHRLTPRELSEFERASTTESGAPRPK